MIKSAPVLPLSHDASSRFLPWLITFMVWLATLALAAVMVLSAAGEQWRTGLTGSVTVQIVPTGSTDSKIMQRRLEEALALLRASPQVVSAAPVPTDKVAALLEPWIGPATLFDSLKLPIPRLIDVTLAPSANGKPPDTFITPGEMSSRDKEMLKHAYKGITNLQGVIASEFGELVI